jgi:sulfur carrier protein
MQISVNGLPREVESGSTVATLLLSMGLTSKRVAVERNGEIVPKGSHAHTALAAGDTLEIVVAVGGG